MISNDENVKISGDDLHRMARKYVTSHLLRRVLKDEFFRDFARIFHFVCLGTAISKKESSFGHVFVMPDEKKRHVQLEIEIKITPKV